MDKLHNFYDWMQERGGKIKYIYSFILCGLNSLYISWYFDNVIYFRRTSRRLVPHENTSTDQYYICAVRITGVPRSKIHEE